MSTGQILTFIVICLLCAAAVGGFLGFVLDFIIKLDRKSRR